MSLSEFRQTLQERLLTLAWRQWTALGVLGTTSSEDPWAIDPEALLIFSLELCRYEPRLFDEILAWLEKNGEWLDNARLRRLLGNQEANTVCVVGGALQYLAEKGQERKWKNLVGFCESKKPAASEPLEPLFKTPTGKFHPRAEDENIDPSFKAFGFNRPRIKVQKEAGEVPVNAASNIRFLMRSLFGVGAKSEVLLYLLTHNEGSPKEIADSAGLFWLSVQQALVDVSKSGLVLRRPHGKKIEYWLSRPKWWSFIAGSDLRYASEPKWLNWSVIFPSLAAIWRAFDEIVQTKSSDYMRGSKLMDIQPHVETVAREFGRAGFHLGDVPSTGLPLELYQEMLLRFLGAIFDVRVKKIEESVSR